MLLLVGLLFSVSVLYYSIDISHRVSGEIEASIQQAQEVVTAKAYTNGPMIVIEVDNYAATTVYISRLYCHYTANITRNNGDVTLVSLTHVIRDKEIPGGRRMFYVISVYDDYQVDPSKVKDVKVERVELTLVTDKGVYTYNPVLSGEDVVVVINPTDVGRTIEVDTPYGEKAYITVYEYLFCAASPGSLSNETLPEWIPIRAYLYGPDGVETVYYTPSRDPSASIEVSHRVYGPGDTDTYDYCTISSSLEGYRYAVLSRGVMLVTTGLAGYDIAVVTPANLNATAGPSSDADNTIEYVTKYPLPRGVDPSVVLTPLAAAVWSGKKYFYALGESFSSAVLVGAAIYGNYDTGTITLEAHFTQPYPLVLVITRPPVWQEVQAG